MPSASRPSALFPQRIWLRVLCLAAVLGGAVVLVRLIGIPGVIASFQLAAATAMLARPRRLPPILAAAASLAACAAWPTSAALLAALGRVLVYVGLTAVFRDSLRAGKVPVATQLARRIHPVLSDRRRAYTRAVTRLWTVFFAAQSVLWLVVLAASPVRPPPHWAFWADLPLAAAVLASELAVRAILFRGQPHGSLSDMIRAARRPPA